MTDQELVGAFEACTLPLSSFQHEQHVRLAYLYLSEQPLLDAMARFVTNLKRYASAAGANNLYHETITLALLLIINERMARNAAADFPDFVSANPDLLSWQPSVLDLYYDSETLSSELARRTFLMPDRG